MPSLTLMHWLLIGNIALLVVVGGLLASLWRQQRMESRRLQLVVYSLQQAHEALSHSAIGMGRRLKQLDGRVQQTERKVVLSAKDEATYNQASRLVSLGATASDLVENCGVARAEAELIVSLNRHSIPPQ